MTFDIIPLHRKYGSLASQLLQTSLLGGLVKIIQSPFSHVTVYGDLFGCPCSSSAGESAFRFSFQELKYF